jgi:MoaA/NifB/PqqE/SkfB family radical SAM enzyme/protein-L-isoaspartate O-methyltransferase
MRGDEFFRRIAVQPPLTKLHPRLAGFFKDYFAREKVVPFGERFVVNTHFPPYPSPAFDNLAAAFGQYGDAGARRLYSVTFAVTNRCSFNCWHCYNAGRSQTDLPLETLRRVVGELRALGAVQVALTGGEPLLREDLEDIAGSFDERSCVIVGTTGAGLTESRAGRLRNAGVFGVGISLDSVDEAEHDRLRGQAGAFRIALDALHTARQAGLYPYVVSVASHDFLQPAYFMKFLRFAGDAGALEVHLLEPSATGKLAGRTDVMLAPADRQRIFDYQQEVAQRDDLPILSAYAYLESSDAFGCGAGLTHLYIDGSGEVCPCQLVPMSFGNVGREPLVDILARMGEHFRKPRATCVGRVFARQLGNHPLPAPPEISQRLCEECLPRDHVLPRFFQLQVEARAEVGAHELRAAYDQVHEEYDAFWLTQAGQPIVDLVEKLPWRGDERVFEAGCGTGYATALLAQRAAYVVAVDLSDGMLKQARQRLEARGGDRVRLVTGDALHTLVAEGPFDVVFSSWVLGYIPLRPFFVGAAQALVAGGRLAFVVHKENSPREPLEIFGGLVAEDPSVLQKRVAFDFPRDARHVYEELGKTGLTSAEIWEGAVTFRFAQPAGVLEHLLKSGAGTAFYDAIDPARRAGLTNEFLARLGARHSGAGDYTVTHQYVACIAVKA